MWGLTATASSLARSEAPPAKLLCASSSPALASNPQTTPTPILHSATALRFFRFTGISPRPRRHPSSQRHEQLSLFFLHPRQILPQPLEIVRVPARVSPQLAVVVPGKFQRLRRLFTVVQNLIKRNLQSAGPFLQSFHTRDGVTVLHARYVRLHQPGGLRDFNLAHVFGFANFP